MRVANATPGTGALASIYAVDSTASPIAGSVVTTDSTGTFNFYAPDGRYDLVAVVGASTKIVTDIEIADITESQSGDAAAKFGTLNFITAFQHNGVSFAAADLSDGVTGSGSIVLATSPSLVTPALGVATATSVNKVVITAPATAATLTLVDGTIITGPTITATLVGKTTTDTLTNKTLTAPTITNPSTTGTDSGTETMTNKRVSPRIVTVTNATTLTPDGDNSDVSVQANTQAGGTLTVAAPTGTPTDGQKLIIRVKSTNAQTYSFNATYAFSTTVTAPVTLGAGKTDYIGLMWNATNTKWDVVAVDQGH